MSFTMIRTTQIRTQRDFSAFPYNFPFYLPLSSNAWSCVETVDNPSSSTFPGRPLSTRGEQQWQNQSAAPGGRGKKNLGSCCLCLNHTSCCLPPQLMLTSPPSCLHMCHPWGWLAETASYQFWESMKTSTDHMGIGCSSVSMLGIVSWACYTLIPEENQLL